MAVVVAIALAIFVLPSPWGIVAVFAGIAIEVAEQVFWFRYQGRRRVRTGVEGHVGERAEVVRALDPEGRVKFRGEVWRARASGPVGVGEAVVVTGTDGLTLTVDPVAAGSDAEPGSRPSDAQASRAFSQ